MPKMPQDASSPRLPDLTTPGQGPPTLTPMMVPGPMTSAAPVQSIMVTMPSIPVKPLYQMTASLPTSTVAPIQSLTTSTDSGPPMLTKETNPPMPNLGPPNISGPPQLVTPQHLRTPAA